MGNNSSRNNTEIYSEKPTNSEIHSKINKLFLDNVNNSMSEYTFNGELKLSDTDILPTNQILDNYVDAINPMDGGSRRTFVPTRNRYSRYDIHDLTRKQTGGDNIDSNEYKELTVMSVSELNRMKKVILNKNDNDIQLGGGINDIFPNMVDMVSPATVDNNKISLLDLMNNTHSGGNGTYSATSSDNVDSNSTDNDETDNSSSSSSSNSNEVDEGDDEGGKGNESSLITPSETESQAAPSATGGYSYEYTSEGNNVAPFYSSDSSNFQHPYVKNRTN